LDEFRKKSKAELMAQLMELKAELKKLKEKPSLPGAKQSPMCARPLSCSLARLSIFGN
jgi:ribosomal protein L29